MNKVILMGRLVRNPELRYSKASTPLAITRYTLAVNRSFKREGQPTADFINIVAFGNAGEFSSKYFKKGQMVSIVGRLQISTNDREDGKKNYFTDVIAEEQHFAEKKGDSTPAAATVEKGGDFFPIDDNEDSDQLPF